MEREPIGRRREICQRFDFNRHGKFRAIHNNWREYSTGMMQMGYAVNPANFVTDAQQIAHAIFIRQQNNVIHPIEKSRAGFILHALRQSRGGGIPREESV